MNSHSPDKIVIIGAGLAGLSCAVRLHEAGRPVEVFEASDGVGGRVRTDLVDGFRLDRGFQVYLDAYVQAGKLLDLPALDLKRFEPGALVWKNSKRYPVMDVFRRPLSLWNSATAPIGNIGDKLRVARLRSTLLSKETNQIWRNPSASTESYLQQKGFSKSMIDDFFRGFYGGIFLEDQLQTSSRIFEFTFKMFSLGYAALPALGMQAIPDQLAARLPTDSIHLNSSVKSIQGNTVHLEGSSIEADHIVLATDATACRQLVPGVDAGEPKWNSTSCLYFAASSPPVTQPIIVLKGDRQGLINNLSVPSEVSPYYAPSGKSLISVSVLGDHRSSDDITQRVQQELVEWFGPEAEQYQHLRTEHIRRALPIDPPGNGAKPPHLESGSATISICGDHTTSGSIEGAIQSGLGIAQQLLGIVGKEKG